MITALTVLALSLLSLCAVLSWVFVARHSRTAWWASHGGRWLMKSKVAMALLFTLTLVAQAIPLRPMTGLVLSILLFGWTAYVLADLLHMQSGEIRKAKAERADSASSR